MKDLPSYITSNTKPIVIDLVLDGGAFNGSYLVGALYLLKEMEKKQYIKINRISGCSIGSVAGFLYFIDALDTMTSIYVEAIHNFKQNHNLQIIKNLKQLLNANIPKNVCSIINNKLFITYNNINNGAKCIKKKYITVDEIFDTIIKSCFIPFIIDGNMLYKNKYIDGITPHIFKQKKNRKILYLDLFGYDKILNILNVKNEPKNTGRVLIGLLDAHFFFTKKSNTTMCSFINDWRLYNYCFFKLKLMLEKIIIFALRVIVFFKNLLFFDLEKNKLYKWATLVIKKVYIILIDTYFV